MSRHMNNDEMPLLVRADHAEDRGEWELAALMRMASTDWLGTIHGWYDGYVHFVFDAGIRVGGRWIPEILVMLPGKEVWDWQAGAWHCGPCVRTFDTLLFKQPPNFVRVAVEAAVEKHLQKQ